MTSYTALLLCALMFFCGYTIGHHNGSEKATKDSIKRIGAAFRAAEREKARHER